MPVVLWAAAPLASHRMSVVITDQPLAAGSVQGERVVEAVRLVARHRHSRHCESNPIPAGRIDNEHLTIELEQGI
jgi:hypothetical protein